MLAAIPSVILGLWGIFVMIPWLREYPFPWLQRVLGWTPFFSGPIYGPCMLAGGIIVAVMILPIITSVYREILRSASGVDQVFIDTGSIADQVMEVCANGVDKVLELVGTTTLKDSLRCAKQRGIVCMTGIVGNKWSLENFAPMDEIPTAVCLTTYAGESEDFMRMPFEDLVQQIAAGTLRVQVGKTFRLDEIVEAHRCMEENKAGGKIVVLT